MRSRRVERRSTPNTPERDIARLLRKLSRLWNVGVLATVRVTTNPRLRSTKARCLRAPLTIELRTGAAQASDFNEVLTHEAAHAALALSAQRETKPHGPSWRQLMKQAGFPEGA